MLSKSDKKGMKKTVRFRERVEGFDGSSAELH